jgi:hypothetical protein
MSVKETAAASSRIEDILIYDPGLFGTARPNVTTERISRTYEKISELMRGIQERFSEEAAANLLRVSGSFASMRPYIYAYEGKKQSAMGKVAQATGHLFHLQTYYRDISKDQLPPSHEQVVSAVRGSLTKADTRFSWETEKTQFRECVGRLAIDDGTLCVRQGKEPSLLSYLSPQEQGKISKIVAVPKKDDSFELRVVGRGTLLAHIQVDDKSSAFKLEVAGYWEEYPSFRLLMSRLHQLGVIMASEVVGKAQDACHVAKEAKFAAEEPKMVAAWAKACNRYVFALPTTTEEEVKRIIASERLEPGHIVAKPWCCGEKPVRYFLTVRTAKDEYRTFGLRFNVPGCEPIKEDQDFLLDLPKTRKEMEEKLKQDLGLRYPGTTDFHLPKQP